MRKLLVTAIALGLTASSVVAASAAGDRSRGQTLAGSTAAGSTAARITPSERRLIRTAEASGSIRILVSMPNAAEQRGVLSTLESTDADVLIRYHAFPILLVEADAGVVTDLASDPRVTGMQQDVAEPPTLASTVPLINADDMHGLGFDGTGTAVAVLDTGIDVDHPFFAGRIVSQACFSNAAGAGGNVTLCPNGLSSQITGNAADAETAACSPGNLCAHGSHVAGIAAGNASGTTPGAPGDGVAPAAGIVAVQVFTRFNSALDCAPAAAPCVRSYNSDQLLGLQRVATLAGSFPIVSANMSLGGGSNISNCDGDTRKTAIDALLGLNIATVIAAGNDGFLNAVGAPGCISTAVTVGATTDADAVAGFSNRGPLLDLFAPGVSVDSSIPDDAYANFQGTSMAAPHVAGAWAVLRDAFPSESVGQILTRLQTTGVPITYSNGITNVTTPRIDLLAAYLSSPPGITFITDRPSFNATCPGLPVEDFEKGNGNSVGFPRPLDSTSNYPPYFIPGDIKPGLSVTTLGPPRAGTELALFSAGGTPGGNLSKVVVANWFVDTYELDFPAGSVTGVGFDLLSWNGSDPNMQIRVYGTSGLLGSTTALGTGTGSFWGVYSVQPIIRIEVFSPLNHAEGADNIAFGLCGGGGGGGPTLTVVKVGPGSGTVTSNPPGINCPPDCSERPVSGRVEATAAEGVYVLTAHPASGSVFTRWSGACTGSSPTCTVVLTTDTLVSAWFDLAASPSPTPSPSPSPTPPPAPITFDLHVSKVGKGRVMSASEEINCGVACTATYDEGSMVTLTATPRPGWVLKRWRYGCSGSELVCTLEMSSNRRAKAVFVKV